MTELVGYASRTGTKRNLDALRDAGWRLLVSARGVLRTEGFGYALDNGAWTAHQKGEPFDALAFERALDMLGAAADWVVAPDIVEGGLESLRLSETWLYRCRIQCPKVLVAVQDGIDEHHVRPWLGPEVGIFVGGSTRWKLASMANWGALGAEVGCHVHVGRVNTIRRIAAVRDAKCHSFDGTSVTRYAETLHNLDVARRQRGLPW